MTPVGRARLGPEHEDARRPLVRPRRGSRPTSLVPRSSSTMLPSTPKVSVAVMQVVMPGKRRVDRGLERAVDERALRQQQALRRQHAGARGGRGAGLQQRCERALAGCRLARTSGAATAPSPLAGGALELSSLTCGPSDTGPARRRSMAIIQAGFAAGCAGPPRRRRCRRRPCVRSSTARSRAARAPGPAPQPRPAPADRSGRATAAASRLRPGCARRPGRRA